jgi:hypothetical protein
LNAIADYLGCIPVGWETRAIRVDGVYYGDVMLQGNEIHVAIAPQYRRRGWSRRIARTFFTELLAEKHFLTTRSMIGDDTEPFIKRLGFVQTNEDDRYRYWWLDVLPFERKHHEQPGS